MKTSSCQNDNAQIRVTKSCHPSIALNVHQRLIISDDGVLAGLGLSGRQARVYLALLRLGVAGARTIAALSLVNRQEVYRLLDGLQGLGLVQRNVCLPATFRATPIDVGVKLLLKRKSSQLSVMNQQAKRLTRKLSQNHLLTCPTLSATKPSLGTVYEANRGKKILQALQTAQHSIEVVVTWTRFKQLTTHFETQLQNALKRDVAVSIVTQKPPNLRFPKWVNAALSSKSNFKVKTSPDSPSASMFLFDGAVAAIAFEPKLHLFKGPDLWTTNQSITTLCQAYFNTVYNA